MSYAIAAYAVVGVSLVIYAAYLFRERRSLRRAFEARPGADRG